MTFTPSLPTSNFFLWAYSQDTVLPINSTVSQTISIAFAAGILGKFIEGEDWLPVPWKIAILYWFSQWKTHLLSGILIIFPLLLSKGTHFPRWKKWTDVFFFDNFVPVVRLKRSFSTNITRTIQIKVAKISLWLSKWMFESKWLATRMFSPHANGWYIWTLSDNPLKKHPGTFLLSS